MLGRIGKARRDSARDETARVERERRREVSAGVAAGIRATAMAMSGGGRASLDGGRTWFDKGEVSFSSEAYYLRVEAPDGSWISCDSDVFVSRHLAGADGRGLEGAEEMLRSIAEKADRELGMEPDLSGSMKVVLSAADWVSCLVALFDGDVLIGNIKSHGDSDGKGLGASVCDGGDLVVVKTAVDDKSVADAIAAEVVRRGLAASAQVKEMESTFVWDGVLKRIAEWEVRLLATRECMGELVGVVTEMHPYDLGGITCMPVGMTTEGFADWVRGFVGHPIGDDVRDALGGEAVEVGRGGRLDDASEEDSGDGNGDE